MLVAVPVTLPAITRAALMKESAVSLPQVGASGRLTLRATAPTGRATKLKSL